MKVYYNGFNLHRQFPSAQNIVENFIDHDYQDLENIEVSYNYVVLLVANVVIIKGAKNRTDQFKRKISQICCTEDKALVLLENGDLLKISDCVTNVPRLIDLNDEDYITAISAGSKLTIALTKQGFLYSVPNKLEFKATDIVEIKTGREHCILRDKNGNVFTFGRGSRGQLGHGSLDDENEPKFVEALGGIEIKSIAAGGWHSCAISTQGDLYVWGWNSNGQLGLCQNEESSKDAVAIMATPQVLNLDFNISKVACGSKHTVVLSDEYKKLYGCGWNKYKQLKSDNKDNFYTMTLLRDFPEKGVKSIKCGPWNTLILCTDDDS